ncbi:transcription initiation factor TFIID subunit 4-like [Choloepus didactylus]|uniref:transcription initiation factor TFIID subunit 4-like n=1 Tax=Choloepus didactylus TaxID=27675 RepID=UPI0018A00C89|nr:transcription initiation factor TFIID subunit 4-like [Choloepus didactylus]
MRAPPRRREPRTCGEAHRAGLHTAGRAGVGPPSRPPRALRAPASGGGSSAQCSLGLDVASVWTRLGGLAVAGAAWSCHRPRAGKLAAAQAPEPGVCFPEARGSEAESRGEPRKAAGGPSEGWGLAGRGEQDSPNLQMGKAWGGHGTKTVPGAPEGTRTCGRPLAACTERRVVEADGPLPCRGNGMSRAHRELTDYSRAAAASRSFLAVGNCRSEGQLPAPRRERLGLGSPGAAVESHSSPGRAGPGCPHTRRSPLPCSATASREDLPSALGQGLHLHPPAPGADARKPQDGSVGREKKPVLAAPEPAHALPPAKESEAGAGTDPAPAPGQVRCLQGPPGPLPASETEVVAAPPGAGGG